MNDCPDLFYRLDRTRLTGQLELSFFLFFYRAKPEGLLKKSSDGVILQSAMD